MRVFIAGIDGYLGWALALHLAARGHDIGGADCFLRREWVKEMGSHSAIPIAGMPAREVAFKARFGKTIQFYEGDLTNAQFTRTSLNSFKPDAIVHLGEMPSAPYSMIDVHHAVWTHTNNLTGTLNILFAMRDDFPDCHLVKLGSLGEYGTPNVPIPEGDFILEYRGRKDRVQFPRKGGSLYHLTKIHDSHNIEFACRMWGLRSTDIMQGVVYGTRIDEMFCEREIEGLGIDDAGLFSDLRTRFDFDQCFGTALHRFCAQVIAGLPVTPYGKGRQKRGFLPLRDSMQCLAIAVEKPPKKGEYRVFNQFEEVYDITQLAEEVVFAAEKRGIKATIRNMCNPRVEAEKHYYKPDHKKLLDLGYRPNGDLHGELTGIIDDLHMHRDRIAAKRDALVPDVRWNGKRKKVGYVK